jgi:hypothetical protein
MKRIILIVIFLTANSLFSHAQTIQPDMTVFGYKLGEKITIPECPCKIVKSKVAGNYGVLSTKHFKGYQYVTAAFTPVTSTCFERSLDEYNVKKSAPLNPLPNITNGNIKVRFAPKDAPSQDMCPTGSFDGVIEDSKLTSVTFLISAGDANNVFEKLKKKYGTSTIVKSYKAQNGYGASINYYTADWTFPGLEVELLSSLHTSLYEQSGTVTIQLPKKSAPPSPDQRKL